MKTVVYKCDFCKKEIPENGLNKISVPLNTYAKITKNEETLKKLYGGVKVFPLDICSSCGTEVAKFFEILGVFK